MTSPGEIVYAERLLPGLDVHDPCPQHLPEAHATADSKAATTPNPLRHVCPACESAEWWTCDTTREPERAHIAQIHKDRWALAKKETESAYAILDLEREYLAARITARRSTLLLTSRWSDDDGDYAAHLYDCPTCNAEEGEPCELLSQMRRPFPRGWVHGPRWKLASADSGYGDIDGDL